MVVTTFPATTGTRTPVRPRACLERLRRAAAPRASSPVAVRGVEHHDVGLAAQDVGAFAATSPLTPTAAPTMSLPDPSVAGRYIAERRMPLRVTTPSIWSPSSTGATSRWWLTIVSNASNRSWSLVTDIRSVVMTSAARANRSTSRQSRSVRMPTGRPSSTTTAAPWARLPSRDSTCATAMSGPTWMGVSKTVCRDLTQATASPTTSPGMSCGRIAMPPRRAMVSAIRRPEMAVMFATTSGIVIPATAGGVKSTSRRDETSERDGTRKTSE